MKKLILLAAIAVSLASCTDAVRAKTFAYGEDYKIEVVNPLTGQTIRTYHSSGKVNSEEASDGFYFMDKATRELTTIAGGTLVITPESTNSVPTTTIQTIQ